MLKDTFDDEGNDPFIVPQLLTRPLNTLSVNTPSTCILIDEDDESRSRSHSRTSKHKITNEDEVQPSSADLRASAYNTAVPTADQLPNAGLGASASNAAEPMTVDQESSKRLKKKYKKTRNTIILIYSNGKKVYINKK